jgi:hypothetical protein
LKGSSNSDEGYEVARGLIPPSIKLFSDLTSLDVSDGEGDRIDLFNKISSWIN